LGSVAIIAALPQVSTALQDDFELMTKRETSAKNRSIRRAIRPRSAERGQLPGEVRLYQDLVGAIIDQRLPAGTRLNEANLAKAYRLTRPRVRTVLSRLTANNIIELRLNFGAFVRRPSPEEARNVYQVRRFLEAGVIQAIAENPTGYNLERLRELVAVEKRAYRNPKPGLHRLSSEFHIILAEVTGNKVLQEILTKLIHHCCLIQSLYMTPAGPPCLVHNHEDLINCLANGDVSRALRVHNRHFDQIEKSLMVDGRNDHAGDLGTVSELAVV
jgi:DNA-binding GntR family transcriptional regulator